MHEIQGRDVRPRTVIGGVRVTRSVPAVLNNVSGRSIAFADGTRRFVANNQRVQVGGYREPFPAGPVASKAGASARRVRVSDGKWAGEAGGFSVRLVSNMPGWDYRGPWKPARKAA